MLRSQAILDRTGPSFASERHEGFVLVVVLWMVVLLALIATGFAGAVNAYMRDARGRIELTRAELAAETGVSLAVIDLEAARSDDGHDRRFAVDGKASGCVLSDGTALSIALQDASGRVNLNLAEQRLLAALFLGLGASPEAATRMADRIMDFRDRDDLRRPLGAEREDYLAQGRVSGPKNAAFDSRSELFQVLGLDAATIAALEPLTTLRSGLAGLDPTVASPRLLALLREGLRQIPGPQSTSISVDGLPAEVTMTSQKRIYAITATARLASGAVFSREAEVDLGQGAREQPSFKEWRRSRGGPDSAVDPSALPPC